jgi:hypothetical protein
MALSYGEQRALNEIASVLSSQWDNGLLPHIRFIEGQAGYSPDCREWAVPSKVSGNKKWCTSGITQPPNIGFALWTVFRGSRNKQDILPFLEKFYPKIRKCHDFLLTKRDPKRVGLASVFHPWATGSDNTPSYDEIISRARAFLKRKGFEQRIKKRQDTTQVSSEQRPKKKDYDTYGRLIGFYIAKRYSQWKIYEQCPFVVQDITVNTLLKQSIHSMAHIASALALYHKRRSKEKAAYYLKEEARNKRLALKVRNAIRKRLFDDITGYFYSFDVKAGRLLDLPDVHSLLPLLGGTASKHQASELIEHLLNRNEFNPENGFMVPSFPIKSKHFENQRYARGPIWPVRNWMIIKGLEHFDKKLAKRLRKQTISLIAQGHKVEKLESLAASVMEYNSFGEEFTTPSRAQYSHGWLWDSGFAAIGWRHVREKPNTETWKRVAARKEKLVASGKSLEEVKSKVKEEFDIPLFEEFYAPTNSKGVKAGDALGAEKMTWTASFFLDLVRGKA